MTSEEYKAKTGCDLNASIQDVLNECPVCGGEAVIIQSCMESVSIMDDEYNGEVTLVEGDVIETYDVAFVEVRCTNAKCQITWQTRDEFIEAVKAKVINGVD